jgi:hypothetical protein
MNPGNLARTYKNKRVVAVDADDPTRKIQAWHCKEGLSGSL